MEELLVKLLERLHGNITELSLVDEDYGQLEAVLNGEESYPVTFPCVLVGNTDVNWSNVTPAVQKGEAKITIRLAIDCYDDTHVGSGTTGKIVERQALSNKVYKTLQGFRLNRLFGPLNRVKSRDYSLPGNIKVYEKEFTFYYHDESAR